MRFRKLTMTASASSPVVSVIIPLFNKASIVPRVLQSVMDQTFTDYEIIVVNDGSTDGSAEAIRPFLDRIHYVEQENRGAGAARNRALALAKGRFVAFLDADDVWLPEKLKLQVDFLRKHPEVAWCTTNWYLHYSGAKSPRLGCQMEVPKGEEPWIVYPDWFEVSSARHITATPGVVIRREVLDRVGGFDESFPSGQDNDLWIRVAGHYPTIGFLPEPMVRVHAHLPGALSLLGRQKWESSHRVLLKHLRAPNANRVVQSSLDRYLCQKAMRQLQWYVSLGYRDLAVELDAKAPAHWRTARWRLLVTAHHLPMWIRRILLAARRGTKCVFGWGTGQMRTRRGGA